MYLKQSKKFGYSHLTIAKFALTKIYYTSFIILFSIFERNLIDQKLIWPIQ